MGREFWRTRHRHSAETNSRNVRRHPKLGIFKSTNLCSRSMYSKFSKGDTVSVEYTSKRSENIVSRDGTVLQTPGEEKKGFFVQTDDDQLTGVLGGRVYSLTVEKDGDERSIQRKTYLGEIEGVSAE